MSAPESSPDDRVDAPRKQGWPGDNFFLVGVYVGIAFALCFLVSNDAINIGDGAWIARIPNVASFMVYSVAEGFGRALVHAAVETAGNFWAALRPWVPLDAMELLGVELGACDAK